MLISLLLPDRPLCSPQPLFSFLCLPIHTKGQWGLVLSSVGSCLLPVSERSDHQPWTISQVFVEVLEVGVTNINNTVFPRILPLVPELRQPGKSMGADNLQSLHSLNTLVPDSSEEQTG